MDLKKIEAIVKWQNLESVIGLRLFLGFCNYYRMSRDTSVTPYIHATYFHLFPPQSATSSTAICRNPPSLPNSATIYRFCQILPSLPNSARTETMHGTVPLT